MLKGHKARVAEPEGGLCRVIRIKVFRRGNSERESSGKDLGGRNSLKHPVARAAVRVIPAASSLERNP